MDDLPHAFADISARLEDLHAIAAEAQCRDNSPDIQVVLTIHLRSGLAALDTEVRAIAQALEARGQ